MLNDKFEKIDICPYCKSDKIEIILQARNWFGNYDEKFFLSKCSVCALVFQNPRIKEEYIGEYYTDDLGYYNPSTVKKINLISKIKNVLNKQILINYFNYSHLGKRNTIIKLLLLIFKNKLYINLTPNYIKGGKLLEIGCSHGANLKKMNDLGWSTIGLEMNQKSANYAKSIGLAIHTDRIENMVFQPNNFDVIALGMVLEHLYKPFDVLNQITDWLKPGGQLIFSIPYFESFEYGLFKEYSYGLHLPHHITFFNKKIIREYLSKLGYSNIRFYFQYFDRDIVASAGYKYSVTKLYRYKILSESRIIRVILVRPLLYILSFFDITSRVTVYATKK